MLLDFLHQHLLHLLRSNILSAFECSIKLFYLNECFDSLFKESNGLEEFCCWFVSLNVDKSFSQHTGNLSNSILCIIHRNVESIVPNFFQLVRIVEMLFSDLKISVKRFLVVSWLQKYFCWAENFRSCLWAYIRSSAVVFVDWLN